MTIFELIDICETRITKLSSLLHTVRETRVSSRATVARRVRRNLIGVLEEMMMQDLEAVDVHKCYIKATTKAERRRDDAEDPEFYRDDFAEQWDGHRLLARPCIHSDGRRAYDHRRRAWVPIDPTCPLLMPVTDKDLRQLAPVLRHIETELGIRFVIERIILNKTSHAHACRKAGHAASPPR